MGSRNIAALERTLWAPGMERALERTLWAPGTVQALERTMWAHGTERALERTLWAHGIERALERTLWAHGIERALAQTVQLNPLDAVLHIQNIAEKENINVEKMLFTSKLKPSRSHRTHIYCIFWTDIYQCCTRVSHKRAQSHVKLM